MRIFGPVDNPRSLFHARGHVDEFQSTGPFRQKKFADPQFAGDYPADVCLCGIRQSGGVADCPDLERQLAELQQQQQQLRNEIERLQNDKNYWEQLARTKLGMVREGELIYHLPDQKKDKK